ncbi:MAG: hypothetical protein ACRDJE_19080 [Dehalococcoidia bacterium]
MLGTRQPQIEAAKALLSAFVEVPATGIFDKVEMPAVPTTISIRREVERRPGATTADLEIARRAHNLRLSRQGAKAIERADRAEVEVVQPVERFHVVASKGSLTIVDQGTDLLDITRRNDAGERERRGRGKDGER